jgi:hypothetical protein
VAEPRREAKLSGIVGDAGGLRKVTPGVEGASAAAGVAASPWVTGWSK